MQHVQGKAIEDSRRNQGGDRGSRAGRGGGDCAQPQPQRRSTRCGLTPAHAVAVARFCATTQISAFDFLSNVTGVDWPDKEVTEKVKVTRTVTKTVDGVETDRGRDRRRDPQAHRAGLS